MCSSKWNLLGKKATGGPPTNLTICSGRCGEICNSWKNCRAHLWTDSPRPTGPFKGCWGSLAVFISSTHGQGRYTTATHTACHTMLCLEHEITCLMLAELSPIPSLLQPLRSLSQKNSCKIILMMMMMQMILTGGKGRVIGGGVGRFNHFLPSRVLPV